MLSFALCLLIALGGFSMMAFANSGLARTNGDAFEHNQTQFFRGFANMQRRVRLGDYFSVPVENDIGDADVDLTVTAPNGTILFCTIRPGFFQAAANGVYARSFRAGQVGNYTVRFTDGDNELVYIVNSFEDREFFIQVVETGDDFMPAFRRASRDQDAIPALDILRLPEFFLAFTNERGETTRLENVNYEIHFTPGAANIRRRGTTTNLAAENGILSNITDAQNGDLELHNLAAGVLTVTFVASVEGSESRFYTHDFTINVQNNFENSTTPSLSVINIPNTHNVNTRLVIPTATASDAFNNNVWVETTVTRIGAGGTVEYVNEYRINEHGFVCRKDGAPYVIGRATFNNRSTNQDDRAFWPSEEGIYTITLWAVNGGGERSAEHVYLVDVRDRLAPRIVDIDEDSIPSDWGRSVIRTANSADINEVNAISSFNIPFPELIDNATDTNALRVTITLENPNRRTVARWYGSVAEFNTGVALNTAYNAFIRQDYRAGLVFNANTGLDFSLFMIDFDGDPRLRAESERNGTWSVIYSVRDANDNGGSGTARRQITMNVTERFDDREGPSVDVARFRSLLPEYVLIQEGRETFLIPSVGVHDNMASRIRQEYTIMAVGLSAADIAALPSVVNDGGIDFEVTAYRASTADVAGNELDVTAGEEFVVRHLTWGTNNQHYGYFLTVVRGHLAYAVPLMIGENNIASIELAFGAWDSVGNELSFEERTGDNNEINTYNRLYAEIDFLFAGGIRQEYMRFETEGLMADENYFDTAKYQGQSWNFGGFDIIGIEHRAYTGFEISLVDPNGNFVTTTSYSFFYPRADRLEYGASHYGQLSSLHVRNITANPATVGTYSLMVRAFDITGVSLVRAFSFEVEAAEQDYDVAGGARAPAIGSVSDHATHTAYRLNDRHVITSGQGGHNIIVRRIIGPSFSLAGNEFTALSAGRFDIEDFWVDAREHTAASNGTPASGTQGWEFINVGTPSRSTPNFEVYTDAANGVRFFGPARSLERYNTIEARQTSTYAIQVHGIMPTYMPHARPQARGGLMPNDVDSWFPNEFIMLPAFVGHSEFVNADITVTALFGSYDLAVRPLFQRVAQDGTPLFLNFTGPLHVASGTTAGNRIETNLSTTTNAVVNDGIAFTFDEYLVDDDGDAILDADGNHIYNIPTNRWAFATSRDGMHSISVQARGEVGSAHRSFEIRIGRTAVPTFTITDSVTSGAVDGYFYHPILGGFLDSLYDFDTIEIRIENPDGTPIHDTSANRSFSRAAWEARGTGLDARRTEFRFDRAGQFRVSVIVTDTESRLSSTMTYTINVTAPSIEGYRNLLPLTIVLIVIGVALIVGAIVYGVRFKPKKVESKQTQAQGI